MKQLLFFSTLVLALTSGPHLSFANDIEYHYDFNQNCRLAYNALFELRISEGKRLLANEKQNNPGNLIPYLLDNYEDFLILFINGDEQSYNQLRKNAEKRIKMLNLGPKNDPWNRYSKSTIYAQWGILKTYFSNYLGAASDLRSSFSLLRENQKLYPNFAPNQILGGMQQAMAGSIPENYQWLGKIFGIKGNIKKGARMLRSYLSSNNQLLEHEAVFYYCYINFYLLSNKRETINFLSKHYQNTSDNHLLSYLKANFYNNNNQAAQALTILRKINNNPEYYPAPIIDYEAGCAAQRLLDDQTPDYFNKFLKNTKGKTFKKSALHKLSIYYLVNGNTSKAIQYKKQILTTGTMSTDVDKQAQRYAESTIPLPNKTLMAAELLCDGGNFLKALKEIQTITPSHLQNKEEQIAYFYRYGRIYQLLNQTENSISLYKEAIAAGADSEGQYAARASLELGYIYEKQGKKAEAISCYQQTLKMKNKDFRDVIQQKAKAGLNRLNA